MPKISWKDCVNGRAPLVWESSKENGNVRISELGIIGAIASGCEEGTNLFEIGTFDGRTTLNLAMNAPPRCSIHTLDLPRQMKTRYALAEGERHMVEKATPGLRYEKYRSGYPALIGRIHQLLGDSGSFDGAPFAGSCSLVFVDGSHAYQYAVSDSALAMKMVKANGVIIWHDYGIWNGVTEALEELEKREGYGLKNIAGTSLVYWKKPAW